VLVNNVANDQRHSIDEITPEFFDERIAINLRPHFFATQAVLASMRARGGGSIVNIGSGSWKNKTPNLSVYATAKSAMLGFTRCWRANSGPTYPRQPIVPGWAMTQRQVSLWVDGPASARWTRTTASKPHRRLDIAHMALFLAADTRAWSPRPSSSSMPAGREDADGCNSWDRRRRLGEGTV
jgi:NAD(P)-dependent dehydrogenase (short-subunit alcohol dehydrogenase family)